MSDTDIASIDSNGVLRKKRSGVVSVKATVEISNTPVILNSLKVTILRNIGDSQSLGVTRGGPNCVTGNTTLFFCVHHEGNYDLASLGLSEIEWQIYYNGQYTPYYAPTELLPYCGDQTGAILRSRIGIYLEYPGDYKILTLRVRAKSECGYWTEWSPGHNFVIYRCGYTGTLPLLFSIYPNPTSNTATIVLNDEDNMDDPFFLQNSKVNNNSRIYEIQLWSGTSLLRTYKTDQTMYQFSVSDLPKGVYFVRVIKDGKTYTQKLIKN